MKLLLKIALAAALVNVAPAIAAPAPKTAVASPEVKKEFEGFIAKFRAAVKANDSTVVAGLTQLPFMKDTAIGDAAQFRDKIYKDSFTAKTRACLQRSKAIFDRDGYKNDYYSIFCGEDIFVFTRTPAGFLFTDISVND